MTLREQILSRIDATPYRPPTFHDIATATRASGADWIDHLAELVSEIKLTLAAGLIDTANGDSGLTYTRKRAPYAPAEKQAPTPTRESIAPWPKKLTLGICRVK